MRAEQYLLNNRVEVFGEYGDTSQMEEFAKAMQEYAKIKCQELLEIVAEKAKVIGEAEQNSDFNYVTADDIVVIDKDSILNAVDLETFCS